MKLSKEQFTSRCSRIAPNRSAAIQCLANHPYTVYLDLDSGYPQVKIIAANVQDYEALDLFLEAPELIIENQQVFTIHDNYSHYTEYNDFTYTIPLTQANFQLLQVFFSDTGEFSLIVDAYKALQHRLKNEFRQHCAESTGYQTYQRLEVYASWAGNDHLYSQFAEMGLHHIEQLRSLQKATLSDPLALVFVKDNGDPILNDILSTYSDLQDIIDSNVIEDYLARYRLETSYSKTNEDKKRAIETLSSSATVLLCGIHIENAKSSSIFAPFTMRVMQCLNEIYKMQMQSDIFQSLVQGDKDIKDLQVPSQTELLQLIGSHGRWTIDGSQDLQGQGNPNHQAWQCGVYYHPIDKITAELLLKSGFEHLSQPEYANRIVHVPHDVFKLLVLCFNLACTEDLDLKELYVTLCAKLIKNRLENDLPIPEVAIDEIKKHPEYKALSQQCQTVNQRYYQQCVFPMIMRELLENAQMQIKQWQKVHIDAYHVMRETGFYTYVFDTDTNLFIPIMIKKEGHETLLTTILGLENPFDFTMKTIRNYVVPEEHANVLSA